MKKSNSLTKLKRSERGQSLVELAISITVLLTILAGVVDLGSAFFVWIELRDAAQEGAVYAAIDPPSSNDVNSHPALRDRILYSTSKPLNLATERANGNLTIALSGSNTPLCTGNTITVTLTYKYSLVTPFSSILLPNPINIRASVTNTILQSNLAGCP